MSLHLVYSYSTKISDEDRVAVDKKVNLNLQEARQGIAFVLALYSAYSIITLAAYASDTVPDPNPGSQVAPGPADTVPDPNQGNQVAPGPADTGLTEAQKGVYTSSGTGICGLTLQTSNFWLGFACGGLLIVGLRFVTND